MKSRLVQIDITFLQYSIILRCAVFPAGPPARGQRPAPLGILENKSNPDYTGGGEK